MARTSRYWKAKAMKKKKRKKRKKKVKIILVNAKPIKVYQTKKYTHYRIRDPKQFVKIRTLDIGRPFKHQLRRGMTPKGRWVTTSVIVERGLERTPMTRRIVKKAVMYQ